ASRRAMVCSSSAHRGPRLPAADCWLQRAPSSAIRQSPRSTFDMDSDIAAISPRNGVTPWGRGRQTTEHTVNSPFELDIPPSTLTNHVDMEKPPAPAGTVATCNGSPFQEDWCTTSPPVARAKEDTDARQSAPLGGSGPQPRLGH